LGGYPRGAFPGAKGCGGKGNILLTYLSLVAYVDSVGGLPSTELSMRWYATGIKCCFIGLTLLGSTQTDDVNGRSMLVHAWLHYQNSALAQQVVSRAQLRHNTSLVLPRKRATNLSHKY